jgi:hypothetical protein
LIFDKGAKIVIWIRGSFLTNGAEANEHPHAKKKKKKKNNQTPTVHHLQN